MIGNLSPPLHDELFALSRIRERLILLFLFSSEQIRQKSCGLFVEVWRKTLIWRAEFTFAAVFHTQFWRIALLFLIMPWLMPLISRMCTWYAQTNENVKQTISGPIRRRLIRPAQLINLIDYSTNHFCGFVCGLIQNFNVFFKYFSQVILRTLTFNYVRKGVKTGKVENYWAKSRVFTPWLGKKDGRKLKVNN